MIIGINVLFGLAVDLIIKRVCKVCDHEWLRVRYVSGYMFCRNGVGK